ncbi:MAG: GAF domain-containing protein [Acholeplasmatales bacterium]|nr:GAF domain-containing protein [Acholeplasmatales bacterium]
MANYDEIITILPSLIDDKYDITSLSNISSLLNMYMDDINWVGFYLLKDNELILGPFQGKPACTSIKVGKGVCGTCIEKKDTILVKNVHEFSGHIACDSASNSEICIPIYDKNNNLYGLLDIDSPSLNRFDETDKKNLEAICNIINKGLVGNL